jgi:hypothetical protein
LLSHLLKLAVSTKDFQLTQSQRLRRPTARRPQNLRLPFFPLHRHLYLAENLREALFSLDGRPEAGPPFQYQRRAAQFDQRLPDALELSSTEQTLEKYLSFSEPFPRLPPFVSLVLLLLS